jgi:poly(3-hydroxybutyrate) depolymerase
VITRTTVRNLIATCALVTLLAGPAVAKATAPASPSDAVTTGVPAGGPAVLYAAPPDAPQLQNRDPRFRAPYEMVSGSERYVDGEYLFTDFIYDDGDTTYPDDFERYGNNAGDLFEYRMSVRGPDLAVRLSLTTFLAPDSTIAVVAFDTDRDPATGSSTLPRDPGLPFPGTDAVLTTWGTGAEWSTWTGTAWDSVPLGATADLDANQITVTVPKEVAQPTGQWAATLVTGLHDPATGGFLPPAIPVGSPAVNIGFRFDADAPGSAPSEGQTSTEPTTYAHVLDFDLLRARGRRADVPTVGTIYRVFASRLESVQYQLETTPGTYEPFHAAEGKQSAAYGTNYLSRLQPYAVHVPPGHDLSSPAPLTFALHGQDADYHWINGSILEKQLGDDRDSIVLSPSGRGVRSWYMDEGEFDLFEAWNDVARHYALDPLRTSMTGVSMGGYGTYRLGLRYPHLFSRIAAMAPAVQGGLLPNGDRNTEWVPGINEDETLVNRWVENARNLPVFHIADMASESTLGPAQLQHAAGPQLNGRDSLDSLGYRYRFWGVAEDHVLAIVLNDYPELTEFLGRNTIEPEPFHVTLAAVPATDRPDLGLVSNRAYWVSDVVLGDAETPGPSGVPGGPADLPTGRVDVVSLGFGKSDAPSSAAQRPGTTASGVPYLEQERTWGDPVEVPKENRIVITASNVRSLTIDPVAARVDCNVDIDINSVGSLDVHLLGCPDRADVIDPAGGLGHVDHHPYEGPGGTEVNDYLVYVPEDWQPTDRLPLFVMVHGCGTTAYQQMQANLLNPIADRERFIVAYPDNGGQCWRAVSEDATLDAAGRPNTTRGGGGDADIIAGMTRQVIDAYGVDTERVYMIGMSSGAFQTSATVASYPELYAAAGVAAGPGYGMAVTCLGYPEAVIPRYAQATVEQMGERARVVPFFTIGGDQDPLGEQPSAGVAGCARLAYLEWLYTNNLVQPGSAPVPGLGVLVPGAGAGDTFQHDPASTTTGQVEGGYAWTRHLARDRRGCQIAERWIVHGMGHYWSGGSTDPAWWDVQWNGAMGFNDPKGPSASQASWDFFKQFTLSGGNTACTPA